MDELPSGSPFVPAAPAEPLPSDSAPATAPAAPAKPQGLVNLLRVKRRQAHRLRRGSSDAYRRRSSSSALLSNKDLLTRAAERARRAVVLDAEGHYPEACKLYRRTIKYLKIVSRRAARVAKSSGIASSRSNRSANASTATGTTNKNTEDAIDGLTPQAYKLCEHWQLVYQQRLSGLEAARPRMHAPGLGHNFSDKIRSRTDTLSPSRSRFSPSRQSRVRRESLSKIPFIEDSVPTEHCKRPPKSVARRPYWLLRMLRASVNEGGFITPSVYVSPLVWSQKGAKVSGLSAKMVEYEKLYGLLTALQAVPLPSDGVSWKTMYKRDWSPESFASFDRGMATFLEGLHNIQISLHHSLSYVPKDRLKEGDAELLVPLVRGGARDVGPGRIALGTGGDVGDTVRGFLDRGDGDGAGGGGRGERIEGGGTRGGEGGGGSGDVDDGVDSGGIGGHTIPRKKGPMSRVFKKMSKIYDRTSNEVLTKRASGGDLQEYAAMIACISDRAQFLDGWLTFFEMPGCSGRQGALPPGATAAPGGGDDTGLKRASMPPGTNRQSRIHAQLIRAGNGLRDVVCIVVWRDLQELLERYMRKSRKAFTRNLEWGEEQNGFPVADGHTVLRTV